MSDADRVRIVRPGETYEGAQGVVYGRGPSRGNVGAEMVCMAIMPMPPGARAKAHHHDGIETIAYLMDGECEVHYGDGLEHVMQVKAGEQTYIPGGVPHAPCNASGAPCTWIVVHGSGDDQDGIVMLPELDAVLEARRPRR
ncbi:MAG: cupin domain-containing protein [Paracoccaceae bacterium]